MHARPEPSPPAETAGALVRDAELKALRRLSKLTESENERVALRASEVLVKYAVQHRREQRDPPPAKTDPKPPAKAAIPHALVHPPAAAPAFRAVPLGLDSPGRGGVVPGGPKPR